MRAEGNCVDSHLLSPLLSFAVENFADEGRQLGIGRGLRTWCLIADASTTMRPPSSPDSVLWCIQRLGERTERKRW